MRAKIATVPCTGSTSTSKPGHCLAPLAVEALYLLGVLAGGQLHRLVLEAEPVERAANREARVRERDDVEDELRLGRHRASADYPAGSRGATSRPAPGESGSAGGGRGGRRRAG